MRSTPLDAATLAAQDAALIVTDHDAVDYQALLDYCPLVVDTRNATRGLRPGRARMMRASALTVPGTVNAEDELAARKPTAGQASKAAIGDSKSTFGTEFASARSSIARSGTLHGPDTVLKLCKSFWVALSNVPIHGENL